MFFGQIEGIMHKFMYFWAKQKFGLIIDLRQLYSDVSALQTFSVIVVSKQLPVTFILFSHVQNNLGLLFWFTY